MILKLPDKYTVPQMFEKVRNGMTIFLRKLFASKYVEDGYKYDTDELKTKIRIYNTFPNKIEGYPLLVVTITNTDFSVQYLQDEVFEEYSESPCYFGKVEFNININIFTRTIKDRDRLVDILLFFIRLLGKNYFRGLDIEYNRNLSITGEDIEIVNGLPLYKTSLTIPCYTEYYVEIDPKELETIQEIAIESLKLLEAGGTND